jgi:hypothetical protein
MASEVITASGTWNWPGGVTSVVAEGIGGGGGGGGASGSPATGGGGKGGGYAKKTITKGVEASLTITIGAAGLAGGSGAGTGGSGGVTEVVQNGTTVLRATGRARRRRTARP